MEIVAILIFLIIVALSIELFACVVYTTRAPLERKRILEYFLNSNLKPFNKLSQSFSQNNVLRYNENPFTGWSLNPEFKNIHGQNIHNAQGFRSSVEFSPSDTGIPRIYCAGGSTTYCTDIERNEETWPHLLGEYLNLEFGTEVEVINGGVGAFNTFQSYVRLSAYIDHLQPSVVIIYHAKNDLNSFSHDTVDGQNVLPDFSNSMKPLNIQIMRHQINRLAKVSYLFKLMAIKTLIPANFSLSSIYHCPEETNIVENLANRVDLSIVKTMHRNMISLCNSRNIPVIYMTQRVIDPIWKQYIQQVNTLIRSLHDPNQNCWVFDLDEIMSHNDELLVDKMHFSPKGCKVIARHIAEYLHNSSFLSKPTH